MARKPHEPDDKSRQQAKTMAGFGLTKEQISSVMGIAKITLEKYYQEDLDAGRAQAAAQVAKAAFQMAVSCKVPAMTMFWLKTQCRWKETHEQVITFDTMPDPKSINADSAVEFIKQLTKED